MPKNKDLRKKILFTLFVLLFKKLSNTDSEQIPEFELYDKNKRY